MQCLERTDFQQFPFSEVVMVLKSLFWIFDFGRVSCLERPDYR